MHDCLSISQWLLSTTRVLGVVLELKVISGRLFQNEYNYTYIAQLVPRPSRSPTNIISTTIFDLPKSEIKKIIADEREGLGTRLCIHAITSYLSTSKVTCIKINWY